jgi:hypothetical protein
MRKAGPTAPLIFLTAMGLALMSAVLTAYFKHQYKMWDVKANASRFDGRTDKAIARSGRARAYLTAMRWTMCVAVVTIVFAVGLLLAVAWVRVL